MAVVKKEVLVRLDPRDPMEALIIAFYDAGIPSRKASILRDLMKDGLKYRGAGGHAMADKLVLPSIVHKETIKKEQPKKIQEKPTPTPKNVNSGGVASIFGDQEF